MYVPSGITINIYGPVLGFDARTIFVYGTLNLVPDGNSQLAFGYRVNIVVGGGGSLSIAGDTPSLSFPVGSAVMFAPNAVCLAASTSIYSYATTIDTSALVSGVSLSSSLVSPFTVFIDDVGSAGTFTSFTIVLEQTGTFTDSDIWPGSYVPTNDYCSIPGGCNLYIRSGMTLLTDSISNLLLNVSFATITIDTGATLQIGIPGAAAHFGFLYPVNIDCYGTVEFVSSTGFGIFLPLLSSLNFFNGAFFSDSVDTALYSYDPTVSYTAISSTPLSASIAGPQFFQIDASGVITSGTTRKPFHSINRVEYSWYFRTRQPLEVDLSSGWQPSAEGRRYTISLPWNFINTIDFFFLFSAHFIDTFNPIFMELCYSITL